MKLLIITQAVDINNPVLGFFHRWVEEFSKNCEKVTVIALGVGEYHLPENVKILSLGKEEFIRSHSYSSHVIRRLVSIYRFYKYIWQERKNYDSVFVHMNQEYILLSGLIWRALNKKIMLWRNHPGGSFLTNLSVFLSDRVFCTSKYSYTARFKKTEIMPVGIDTDIFKATPSIKRIPRSILFLGRMTPIKKPDELLDALLILGNKNVDFTANFYGDPLSSDMVYYRDLKDKVKSANLDDRIKFYSSVPNYKTPEIYNQHDIFINLSPSGMYDKTIFEAMVCGCLPIVTNRNLIGVIKPEFILLDKEGLSEKIEEVLKIGDKESEKKFLINYVADHHSLSNLIDKLKIF